MQKTKEANMDIIADGLKRYGYTRNNPFKIIPNLKLNVYVNISNMNHCNIHIDAAYIYIEDRQVFVANSNYDEISIDCLQVRDVEILANALSVPRIY